MSNFVLNHYLEKRGNEIVEDMIKEYNNPDLTKKGKLGVLNMTMFMTLLEGYNMGRESYKTELIELKDKLLNYEWEKYPDRMGQ